MASDKHNLNGAKRTVKIERNITPLTAMFILCILCIHYYMCCIGPNHVGHNCAHFIYTNVRRLRKTDVDYTFASNVSEVIINAKFA